MSTALSVVSREYPALPENALIPFESTSGPKKAKIALVGEAWGKSEALVGLPFMGYSGQELTRLLADADIQRSQCFVTNVFPFQPSVDNKIETLCGPKGLVGAGYSLPPLSVGKYILPDYLPCLERLKEELEVVRPNIIVALGNTASWALLQQTAISRIRGTVADCVLIPGIKVLPTFHPASILRNWAQRPITFADLLKAKIESEYPEIRVIHRQVLIDPHIHELWDWYRYLSPSTSLACDIETKNGQITMISFASSPFCGVVVPFIKPKAQWSSGVSYWPTLPLELDAWDFVATVLAGPHAKTWQNGLYDLQYLSRMGFKVKNCQHDTMLLHHSLYPELPKSLGFLGSIYTNERSWKQLRTAKEDEKKDA